MYKTCIFDLYGTLVDIHTDEEQQELWEKLALFYGYYGAFYGGEELKTTFRSIIAEMESGKERLRKDSHEAFPEIKIEKVFKELFRRKQVEADERLAVYTGQFFRVMSTEYIRLYEGVEKMLETLKENGKALYLLSNAQRIFTEYEMKALHIFEYFDGIFISSDHDCKKPDRRFFEKFLETYEIEKESAVMIGNDGICDIRGATDVGLATVYVHSNISPKEKIPKADYLLKETDMEKLQEILLQE